MRSRFKASMMLLQLDSYSDPVSKLNKSRDFTISDGLCRLCRRIFDQWQAWPEHPAWSDAYPGDLILPESPGFQFPALISTECCLSYQYHPRLDSIYEIDIHPIRRRNSEIAYHECQICSLMHKALRLQNPEYSLLDIAIFPCSKDTVRISLHAEDSTTPSKGTWLRLSRLCVSPDS